MLQIVKQKPGSYPFLNLTGKYGPESGEWKQKNHNIKIIDQILFETISTTYIRYKDNFYFDDIQEMLKREYLIKQYGKKMQNLAQYYKFHRCLPFWNDNQVDNIMSNYYSRLKDVDYKRIKSLLKRQQNISLTTQKSFSSFSNSEQTTKKSHYSSILNDLQHSNDTFVLRDICNKISEATQQVQSQLNFKGKYCTGEEKFEQFLSKETKKNTINEGKNIQKPKVIKLHTKKESNKKNKISTETMTTLGRNSSGSNRLLLASRQLRQKFTIDENKGLSKCKDVKSASSLSISKKNIKELSFKNVSKDKFASTKLLYEDKARGSSTSRSVLSSRKALRKINNEKLKQSIQSKIDIENPIVNFRTRSNSTHSEKSKTFGSKTKQKTSQKQKNALQSTLKGSIPISVARGSIIELTNIKRQIKNFKSESERSVQRKSSEKMQLGGNNRKKVKQFEWGQKVLESSKHERTMSSYQLKENLKVSKNEKIYGKKRNSVVQNMLQKKLVLFKKKHAL